MAKVEISEEEILAEEVVTSEQVKDETEEAVEEKKPAKRTPRSKRQSEEPKAVKKLNTRDVITLQKNSDVISERDAENEKRHELQNSFLTKKVLTGTLSSIERMRISEEQTIQVAIADYKGIRIIIPLTEMNIILDNGKNDDNVIRQIKIASNMIGCEIDFTVTSTDEGAYSAVASRKDAMKRKIQDFYMADEGTSPVIEAGKIVEARIIAVAETVLRLEVFGIECFVRVLDMNPAWVADARDYYSVGNTVRVLVKEVVIQEDKVTIEVDGKTVIESEQTEKHVCTSGSRYLGEVTGTHKGMYFVRLRTGVNAIAHTSQVQGARPGKKDEVAFVCTRMDVEKGVAIGIITRIVKKSMS